MCCSKLAPRWAEIGFGKGYDQNYCRIVLCSANPSKSSCGASDSVVAQLQCLPAQGRGETMTARAGNGDENLAFYNVHVASFLAFHNKGHCRSVRLRKPTELRADSEPRCCFSMAKLQERDVTTFQFSLLEVSVALCLQTRVWVSQLGVGAARGCCAPRVHAVKANV